MNPKNFESVEEYISSFPVNIQIILSKIRSLIKIHAPEAIESISYGMPAYKTFKKPLVYFAAQKKHIGFYATPSGHIEFKEELRKYKGGKGSVQFPLKQEIPYDLIVRMVKFRVQENHYKRIKNYS